MVSGRIPGSVVTSETRLMSTVIGRGSLQPASLLEEREQDGAGDDQAAHPDAPEGHCGVDPLDQPSEVLSEEPGWLVQRVDTAVAFWGIGMGSLIVSCAILFAFFKQRGWL